jgi:hypothetical protein
LISQPTSYVTIGWEISIGQMNNSISLHW